MKTKDQRSKTNLDGDVLHLGLEGEREHAQNGERAEEHPEIENIFKNSKTTKNSSTTRDTDIMKHPPPYNLEFQRK